MVLALAVLEQPVVQVEATHSSEGAATVGMLGLLVAQRRVMEQAAAAVPAVLQAALGLAAVSKFGIMGNKYGASIQNIAAD